MVTVFFALKFFEPRSHKEKRRSTKFLREKGKEGIFKEIAFVNSVYFFLLILRHEESPCERLAEYF